MAWSVTSHDLPEDPVRCYSLRLGNSKKATVGDVSAQQCGAGPSRALDLAGDSAVYTALSRASRSRETSGFGAGVLEERARAPHCLLWARKSLVWGTFPSHQSGGNAKPGGPASMGPQSPLEKSGQLACSAWPEWGDRLPLSGLLLSSLCRVNY